MALAGAVALLAAGCKQGEAGGALAAVVDPYARAGQLAKLPDGRKLNLRCSGQGAPTVILESGFAAGASAWVKVQPELSRTTRVCAYDRAGYGFSDPGPAPRDAAAIARDLDQGLRAAGIEGPFVLAGHSAGGLYARVFAARRPQDVRGLLLLDPTVERRAPRPGADGLDGLRTRVRRCLTAAEAMPPPGFRDPVWSGCTPMRMNARDREIYGKPAIYRTQLSELDELFGRASEQVFRARGQLGAIPIHVITASATAGGGPGLGFDGRTPMEFQHLMMAQWSRTASQRTVNSSHLVMLDRPDVVIAAAQEMVAAAREGREPQPLPPSETDAVPDTSMIDNLMSRSRDLLQAEDLFPAN